MKNRNAVLFFIFAILQLAGCGEKIEEPTCLDLRRGDQARLEKQEKKFPELMHTLQQKCPNLGDSSYQPSAPSKGLIR